MLFTSFSFLIFLPLFCVAYWGTHGRARLWVCLIASYIFYGWWDWRFAPLLLTSTLLDYALGIRIEEADAARKKRWVVASVVVNLAFLGVFKYFNFFVDSIAAPLQSLGFGRDFDPFHIVLPVGISFYVFKTMSYTIDVYRGKQPAERDLLRYATFVAFFPELVAGPIVRASTMLPQLRHDHPFSAARLESGLQLMLSGYVRKLVIADSLAPVVDVRFAHPEAHSALSLLVGVYFYAFQIYCDFSGYSAIAIGLARIFGFDFGINFDRPYLSRSFSEFWTRWHISLSSWLRDYLYIPLGGNRGGTFMTYRNLVLTMLLGGLWHGASWTFVAWGALHGAYLVFQRLLSPVMAAIDRTLRPPKLLRDAALVLLVFHLTCLAWVLFRAQTFDAARTILARIAGEGNWSVGAVEQRFLVVKGAALVGGLALVELLSSVPRLGGAVARVPALRIGFAAACLWLIAMLGTFSGTAFIYFQF